MRHEYDNNESRRHDAMPCHPIQPSSQPSKNEEEYIQKENYYGSRVAILSQTMDRHCRTHNSCWGISNFTL